MSMYSDDSDEVGGAGDCTYVESIVLHTNKPLSKAAKKRMKQQQKNATKHVVAHPVVSQQTPPPRAWGSPHSTTAPPPSIASLQRTPPPAAQPNQAKTPPAGNLAKYDSPNQKPDVPASQEVFNQPKGVKPPPPPQAPYVFSTKEKNPKCVVVDAATLLRNDSTLLCLKQLVNYRKIELIVPVEVIHELDRVEKEARIHENDHNRGANSLHNMDESRQQGESGDMNLPMDLSKRFYPELLTTDFYEVQLDDSEEELSESLSASGSEDWVEDVDGDETHATPKRKWRPPTRTYKFCNTAVKRSLGLEFYSHNLSEGSSAKPGPADRSDLENYVFYLKQREEQQRKERNRLAAPQKVVGKKVSITDLYLMCRDIFDFVLSQQKRGKKLAKQSRNGTRTLDIGVTVSGSKERTNPWSPESSDTLRDDILSCAEWYQMQLEDGFIVVPTVTTTTTYAAKQSDSVLIITNDPALNSMATRRGISSVSWEDFVLSQL